MYQKAPLETFLSDLAARKPAPGGGAGSALAGSAGAALAAMAAAFTTGNEKFKAVEAEAETLRAQCDALRVTLAELMDRDVLAYQAWSEARKLPKDTPEQKEARKAAMAKAQEDSTAVPEAILAACLEALKLSRRLAEICNPNLIADVAVAAYALDAGARGAALQARGNLKGVPGAEAREAAVRAKVKECSTLARETHQRVLSTMGLSDDT